ncbi:MAG: helix-turn-helix domain-containing protein [Streptomycetales bacterium]
MTDRASKRGLSPTVRRRRLATALREHRSRSGLSREQVADQMEWSVSKVYRLEHARTSASWRDVRDLCDLYGVPRPDKDALIQLARDSRQRGWWTEYQDVFTGSYVGFESEASAVRTYEAQLIPGLLQTEDYARAVIRALRPTATDDEIERRVTARMKRQGMLNRDQPPEFSCILDEAALRRCLASGHDIAAGQWSALVNANKHPNVTIRVLPFSAGLHACMEGSFVILDFAESADLSVAYIEGLMGDVYVESIEGVSRYSLTWDRMADLVLPLEKFADLIGSELKGQK